MSYQNKRIVRINKLVEAAINRINLDILKEDDNKPGIKVNIKDLSRVNPDQLSKLATKTDVTIVGEAAETDELINVSDSLIVKGNKIYVTNDLDLSPEQEVTFDKKNISYTAITGKEQDEEGNYLLTNIKKVQTTSSQTPEPSKIKVPTEQEDAVYNLKNWAEQLQIDLGDPDTAPNNTLKYGYINPSDNNRIDILVMSNGLIKMSGHVVQNFNDFKNLINWHKEN